MKVTRTASDHLFENRAVIVPAGRRSSILERSGERNFREKARNGTFFRSGDFMADLTGGDMNNKMKEYTFAQGLINNIPYFAMMLFGAAVFIVGFVGSDLGLILAVAYLTCGVAGAFWIMIFVCPHCRYWKSRLCPCGYGRLSAMFRRKSFVECFDERFKRHIPVIVPLWFMPIVAGLPVIIRSFSWMLLVLLVLFALDAFVVLPVVSIKHGCRECPQKNLCPWLKIER